MSDPTPSDAEMTTDVPALLARADLVHLGRQVALVAEGTGFTTEVYGVKIAKCDDRGRTEADIRAEKAEAERDRAKETCKTLGRIIEHQGRDILKITGLHHMIEEDGDGDWGAVWENAYSLPTVSEWRQYQAELAAAREALARVKAIHAPIRVYDECKHDDDRGCEPVEVYDYMGCTESVIGWGCAVCCYDDECPREDCPHGAIHDGVTREQSCPTHAALQPATDEGAGLPLHRTEAGYPSCSTCDGGGCLDCTDPA